MPRQSTRTSGPGDRSSPKPVNLALQGGGAHGAFAWGVLDRLVEDDRLTIEAISATSAGAMNAVAFAYGMAIGGADGGRAKLHEFWQEVSRAGNFYNPVRAFPWDQWLQASGLGSRVIAGVFRLPGDDAPVFALSAQSLQLQSAQGCAGQGGGFRPTAHQRQGHAALPLGYQRPHWQDQGIRQRRDNARRRACLGLSALHFPGR